MHQFPTQHMTFLTPQSKMKIFENFFGGGTYFQINLALSIINIVEILLHHLKALDMLVKMTQL